MFLEQPVAQFVGGGDAGVSGRLAEEGRDIREGIEGAGDLADGEAGNGAQARDHEVAAAAIGFTHRHHLIAGAGEGG